MVSPLDGLLVVDATSGVAGQFAGRLLARYGARVVLVEPPGGTPTRRMPPLRERAGDGTLSFLFWNLNEGKQSAVADLTRAADRAAFDDLCRRADVILHDRAAPLPPACRRRLSRARSATSRRPGRTPPGRAPR